MSFSLTPAKLFRAIPLAKSWFENERSTECHAGEIKLGDTTDQELTHFVELARYPCQGGKDFVKLYSTLDVPLIANLASRYECETILLFARDLVAAAIRGEG